MDKVEAVKSKLTSARLTMLADYPFYGLLMRDMELNVKKGVSTAYTDGRSITFGVEFAYQLNHDQIMFVLLHELLHIVLHHVQRVGDYTNTVAWNIACDLVVNSILMDSHFGGKPMLIFGKESMHLCPNGVEGREYTAEEIYEKFYRNKKRKKPKTNDQGSELDGVDGVAIDEHDCWRDMTPQERTAWDNKIVTTVKTVKSKFKDSNRINGCGLVPAEVESEFSEFLGPKLNWKQLLNDFVQTEVNDYSFSRTDRRYDGDILMPDWCDTGDILRNVHFWVDTSYSMSNEQMTEVFSEVLGAVRMYAGALSGYLGFFDAKAYPMYEFDDVKSLEKLRPIGRGGTSFYAVFDYISKCDVPPAVIIILTDGGAEFPPESHANSVPVMWVINNERVTPPWGRVVRLCFPDQS